MTVYLVGAGPGDPGLLTRRGEELLKAADVVVHDRLIDPSILDLPGPGTEIVDVGKQPGRPSGSRQREINDLLVAHGRAGKVVVRLKGGDPFVFGRGGEEAEALDRAGVPWEVVPGVSSAFAVPAAAGVPVTHRGLSTSVTVVTGHVGDPTAPGGVDWESLAKAGGTLVILMGMANRDDIAQNLRRGGRPPDTPVAVIEWGTTSRQRVARTTLAGLGTLELGSPSVIVVGAVAGLALAPPRAGPLEGTTIVVTRPRRQAASTVSALAAAGARVLEVPVTVIVDAADQGRALAQAAQRAGAYDWVVFTSANAVHRFLGEVRDLRALAPVRLAAVGGVTAAALAEHGVLADLVPATTSAGGVVAEFPAPADSGAARGAVLFPRAAGARPTLPAGLRAQGWRVDEVDAYRTVPETPPSPEVCEALRSADAVSFAAPSAVDAYLEMRDAQGRPLPVPSTIACIGPVTAEHATRRGLEVRAIASSTSPEELVAALDKALGGTLGRLGAQNRS